MSSPLPDRRYRSQYSRKNLTAPRNLHPRLHDIPNSGYSDFLSRYRQRQIYIFYPLVSKDVCCKRLPIHPSNRRPNAPTRDD